MDRTSLRITPHRRTRYWRRKRTVVRSKVGVGMPLKTYSKADVGRRGRGRKVIPKLKKGLITDLARNIDVISKDETLMEGVSRSEMPQLARAMISKFGYKSARGKVMALYVLNGGAAAKDRARAKQRRFFKALHKEVVKQGRSRRE